MRRGHRYIVTDDWLPYTVYRIPVKGWEIDKVIPLWLKVGLKFGC